MDFNITEQEMNELLGLAKVGSRHLTIQGKSAENALESLNKKLSINKENKATKNPIPK